MSYNFTPSLSPYFLRGEGAPDTSDPSYWDDYPTAGDYASANEAVAYLEGGLAEQYLEREQETHELHELQPAAFGGEEEDPFGDVWQPFAPLQPFAPMQPFVPLQPLSPEHPIFENDLGVGDEPAAPQQAPRRFAPWKGQRRPANDVEPAAEPAAAADPELLAVKCRSRGSTAAEKDVVYEMAL